MILRDVQISALRALIMVPVLVTCFMVVQAQVMESTNYKIESDSVNFGGGLSTSTSYRLESTGGEIGTGDATSTNFNLRAGYQQMVNSFISMSSPESVVMTPSIPGVSGGFANGSTTVTVTTDSGAGYQLTILASASPALTNGGDSIADYVPGGVPDFTFTTEATDAHFGYSPSGGDVVDRFKDNGTDTCNTGAEETTLACWDGLDTVGELIAEHNSANTPNGTSTIIHFRVGVGGSVVQAPGTYTATTTLTAVSL